MEKSWGRSKWVDVALGSVSVAFDIVDLFVICTILSYKWRWEFWQIDVLSRHPCTMLCTMYQPHWDQWEKSLLTSKCHDWALTEIETVFKIKSDKKKTWEWHSFTYSEKKYTDNAPNCGHHNVFKENHRIDECREFIEQSGEWRRINLMFLLHICYSEGEFVQFCTDLFRHLTSVSPKVYKSTSTVIRYTTFVQTVLFDNDTWQCSSFPCKILD